MAALKRIAEKVRCFSGRAQARPQGWYFMPPLTDTGHLPKRQRAPHGTGGVDANVRELALISVIACFGAEAAQVMLSAPRELAQIHDSEGWWVERRVLARNLLDIGDARSAYLVVRDAAEPTKENSRVERHFMAGWIALRFLDDTATAAAHFARIQDVPPFIYPPRGGEIAHRPGRRGEDHFAVAQAGLTSGGFAG
jgi:hypothetical protein